MKAQHAVSGLTRAAVASCDSTTPLAARGRPRREPDERRVQSGEFRGATGSAIDPPEREPVAHATRHGGRALPALPVTPPWARTGSHSPGSSVMIRVRLREASGHWPAGSRRRRRPTGRRRRAGRPGRSGAMSAIRWPGLHALGDEERGDPLRLGGELPRRSRARPTARRSPRRGSVNLAAVDARKSARFTRPTYRSEPASAWRPPPPAASPMARQVPITRADRSGLVRCAHAAAGHEEVVHVRAPEDSRSGMSYVSPSSRYS